MRGEYTFGCAVIPVSTTACMLHGGERNLIRTIRLGMVTDLVCGALSDMEEEMDDYEALTPSAFVRFCVYTVPASAGDGGVWCGHPMPEGGSSTLVLKHEPRSLTCMQVFGCKSPHA